MCMQIGLEYLSGKSYEDIVTLLRGRGYLPKAEVQVRGTGEGGEMCRQQSPDYMTGRA